MTNHNRVSRLILFMCWVGCMPAVAETLAETVARLNNELAALRTRVDLASNRGKQVAYLGNSGDDSGFLRLNADDGSDYLRAFATNKAGGGIVVLNAERKIVADINTATQNHGGYIRLSDRNGREIAFMGSLVNGRGGLFVDGDQVKDFAETFETAGERPAPGTVMVTAGDGRHVTSSREAYDSRVLGVVSGAGGMSPGLVFGSVNEQAGTVALALSGQVYVRVCGENGPIQPGDLLVSSSTRGVAMRASRGEEKAFGAVLGKALEPHHDKSEGLLRMLVMLH